MKILYFFLITLGLLCTQINLYGQDADFKLGEVTVEEMQETNYDLDTTASAIILEDFLEFAFSYQAYSGSQTTIKRYFKMKVLKPEGVWYANTEILLLSSFDKIKRLDGFTYNLESGKLLKDKLNSDDQFTEKVTTNWIYRKIAMPNVKVGSIIEFQYEVLSPYFKGIPTLYFQTNLPIKYIKRKVVMPDFINFNTYTQGHHPLTSYKETIENGNYGFKYRVYNMDAHNVPAIKEEPFMTIIDDYKTQLEFQLSSVEGKLFQDIRFKDWPEIERSLNESNRFGLIDARAAFLNKIADSIRVHSANSFEMAYAVHSYVLKKVKWNKKFSIYSDNLLLRVFKDKEGNSAEINLMMLSLFKILKLEAFPVIISTRENGKIHPVYPIIGKYNHVILTCIIDGKSYFLDATDPFIPFGELPENMLNGLGRVIKEKNSHWIEVGLPRKIKSSMNIKFKFLANGTLEGSCYRSVESLKGSDIRREFSPLTESEKKQQALKGWEAWSIDSFRIENESEKNLPINFHYTISGDESVTQSGNTFFLDVFPRENSFKNPFKSNDRNYPIDMPYPWEETYLMTLEIPEGMIVDELPEETLVTMPDNKAIYRYSVSKIDNKITVFCRLTINKSFFGVEEYKDLKKFFDIVESNTLDQIVLKKS